MDRILRIALALGVSSALTVALGAARYKVIAVELGASGIGILGILTTLLALGGTLFGLGLSTSGVRAVAAGCNLNEAGQLQVQRALLRGTGVLGLISGIIAAIVAGLTIALGLLEVDSILVIALSVGLAAQIFSGGQLAYLNGVGQIKAMVWAQAAGALVGTSATIGTVLISDLWGLSSAVAGAPIATLFFTTIYVRRVALRPSDGVVVQWASELKSLVTLGGVVTLGLLCGNLTQVAIRLWLQAYQNLATVGYFQAAWSISTLYLAFILKGLAAEFYPRISARSSDHSYLNEAVDRQVRIAVVLGGPVILGMIALSPLVLSTLYSPEFSAASSMLSWQLLGDLLRIVGWAIGFLLLAKQSKISFLLVEISWNVSFLAIAFVIYPSLGIEALGIAYLCSYGLYNGLVLLAARRSTQFKLSQQSIITVGFYLILGVATLAGSRSESTSPRIVSALCVALALGTSLVIVQKWRLTEKKDGAVRSSV